MASQQRMELDLAWYEDCQKHRAGRTPSMAQQVAWLRQAEKGIRFNDFEQSRPPGRLKRTLSTASSRACTQAARGLKLDQRSQCTTSRTEHGHRNSATQAR